MLHWPRGGGEQCLEEVGGVLVLMSCFVAVDRVLLEKKNVWVMRWGW